MLLIALAFILPNFTSSNPIEGKKSKADIESTEGKMSVAPDGKPKKSEDTLISREDEEGEDKE